MFRALAGVIAALLAFAAALNVNDPDPVRWVAIYGVACVVSVVVAVMGTVPAVVAVVVGGVALAWALVWAMRGPNLEAYAHMFDEWEMKSAAVEEARETCGLLIVAGWMATLVIHAWSH